MKPIEHYVERIRELSLAHNEHFKEISVDGKIDYGESLNTRELLRSFQSNLQILKREAARDLREVHTRDSEKILVAGQSLSGAERAKEIHRLETEQNNHEAAYNTFIKHIDFLLVGIPQNSKMIEEHIAALEAEMNAEFDELENIAFEDVTVMFDALEDEDSVITEMTAALEKWQAIMVNIEGRQSSRETQTPQQRAYELGVHQALQLAAADVRDILDLIENRAS